MMMNNGYACIFMAPATRNSDENGMMVADNMHPRKSPKSPKLASILPS
jgi:hypothetical protein